MTRALIVVDVQKDFVEGGSLAVEGGLQTAYGVFNCIGHLRDNSDLYQYYVATKDFHNPHDDNGGHFGNPPDFADTWPAHCVQGSEGSEFAGPLTKDMFDDVFYKGQGEPAYSGFEGLNTNADDLGEWLRGNYVTHVDICGIATDYCVKATAVDAIEQGFNTTILSLLTVAVGGDKAKYEAIDYIKRLNANANI